MTTRFTSNANREPTASAEIAAGERFGFGENWASFLELVNDERIASAEQSLAAMLGTNDLTGKTFIDIGSGSGLFSLAARNLGATVTSFDYDPQSVACTDELRRRYHPDDPDWTVQQGSILDTDYLAGLGTFDIVYSWGVLHHTGDMWTALKNTNSLANPHATLYIAIYNDQGRKSRNWKRIKQFYNRGGVVERRIAIAVSRVYLADYDPAGAVYRVVKRIPKPQTSTPRARGMDKERDFLDWVGGYPFEVAKPEEIFNYFRGNGWALQELKTCGGGLGCNEFVFTR